MVAQTIQFDTVSVSEIGSGTITAFLFSGTTLEATLGSIAENGTLKGRNTGVVNDIAAGRYRLVVKFDGYTVSESDEVVDLLLAVGTYVSYRAAVLDPAALDPVLEAIAALETASATWTDAEKAQIRYRLGLDGTATAPAEPDVDPIVITPATGIMTTGYLVTRVKGVPTAGITIRYQQAQEPAADRGSSYDDTVYSATSNSEGIAELSLVKGGLYYVWRSAASRPMNVAAYRVLKADGTAPDATLALPSHVGA